ncbi:Gfo/Idh/MocA family protein [Methylomagnum sp.]
MERTLNIGVVGCGYWGPNLIRNFQSHHDCRVKRVCDFDENRLSHIKSLYPDVETGTSYSALTEDSEIDAIVIATPVSTHHRLAKQSLSEGKHTFIEKPMAASAKECHELKDLADSKSLTLMIGHTFLYSSPVRKVKEIIDSGEIGEVLYIRSARLNLGLFQKDINVAWDLAPHDISIILYLLEEAPISVNCQGKAHINQGVEDIVNLSMNFASGSFAIVQNSWLDPKKVRTMTIVGSKGMIVYDDNEPLEKIRIYDVRVEVPPYYENFAEFQYSYHYGDVRVPFIKQTEPLKVECRHFLDCIRTGDNPISGSIEGLRVVEILEASSKSIKENRQIHIDFQKVLAQPGGFEESAPMRKDMDGKLTTARVAVG